MLKNNFCKLDLQREEEKDEHFGTLKNPARSSTRNIICLVIRQAVNIRLNLHTKCV